MVPIVDFQSGMGGCAQDVASIWAEVATRLCGTDCRLTGMASPGEVQSSLERVRFVGLVPPSAIARAYSCMSGNLHLSAEDAERLPLWPRWRTYPRGQGDCGLSSGDICQLRPEARRPAYGGLDHVVSGCADFYGLYVENWRAARDHLFPFPHRPRDGSDGPGLDGPAILLCPRNIESIYGELLSSGWALSPEWALSEAPHRAFLRMTLIHELGHHFWPCHLDSDRARLSEGMANGLVYQLSDYRNRKYLFYKTRLLQSPEYGSYIGLVHRDLWRQVVDCRGSSWPGVRELFGRSHLVGHPFGFWSGQPCCVFHRSSPGVRELVEEGRECSLRAAAVEHYLTEYLMYGRWRNHHDHTGEDGLRDVEVIHALYEAVLGHGNEHQEVCQTLHQAAAAGPVTFVGHGDTPPAEVIAAGRALAFEFPETPEGQDIIRRSLTYETDRRYPDCYCWVPWPVGKGFARFAAQAIPIARELLTDPDPTMAARAKSVLGHFVEDLDDFWASAEADSYGDLLVSNSAPDREEGVCKLKNLARGDQMRAYRPIVARYSDLSPAIIDELACILWPD